MGLSTMGLWVSRSAARSVELGQVEIDDGPGLRTEVGFLMILVRRMIGSTSQFVHGLLVSRSQRHRVLLDRFQVSLALEDF